MNDERIWMLMHVDECEIMLNYVWCIDAFMVCDAVVYAE